MQESREALDAVLTACRAGKADVLVAVASDRISRSLRHLLNVEAELSALGVGLLLTRGQADTTTPHGRLMFSMVGAFAQFERDTISARIKQALAVKKAAGVKLGRPSTAPDAAIRRAKQADPSLSVRALAARFGVGVATAHKALRQAVT